ARPVVVSGRPVRIVPDSGLLLVAGIRRPRTYCSLDVLGQLSPAESRAVLLHERHHEQVRAPARLVALAGLESFLRWSGVGRLWLHRQRARIEIEADRYALHEGALRSELASALIKLQQIPRADARAAFGSATELRLRA